MLSNIVGIQSNQKEVFMSDIKRYILTIEYNAETEEIEYIQEEMVNDGEDGQWEYADLILDDYFDEEGLELVKEGYILGIS
tara:strand:- start:111 stop:353 length:243 start_codon:yes stop_codon:yes gene_type:complete